jgi:hypothetical protein
MNAVRGHTPTHSITERGRRNTYRIAITKTGHKQRTPMPFVCAGAMSRHRDVRSYMDDYGTSSSFAFTIFPFQLSFSNFVRCFLDQTMDMTTTTTITTRRNKRHLPSQPLEVERSLQEVPTRTTTSRVQLAAERVVRSKQAVAKSKEEEEAGEAAPGKEEVVDRTSPREDLEAEAALPQQLILPSLQRPRPATTSQHRQAHLHPRLPLLHLRLLPLPLRPRLHRRRRPLPSQKSPSPRTRGIR